MPKADDVVKLMRLQVDIPEDLKTWLRIHAFQSGQTMSEIVADVLKNYRAEVESQSNDRSTR